MKCEHCGINEATFFVKNIINGRVSEQHLCQDCAKKMGLMDRFHPMFQRRNFFSPFSLLDPFLSGMGSHLLEEFPEPEVSLRPAQTEVPTAEVNPDQQRYINQRKRNALQAKLDAAIASEDFETACKIRDEIHALPQD